MAKLDAKNNGDRSGDDDHAENANAAAAACSSSPARPSMAQPHVMNDDHSHVIDIDAGGGGGGRRSCAVCMEPLEWAAIGPCGHGEVCAGCALHIRVFQNNRHCCICRSLCRVVVVTNPDAIAAAGGWPAVSSRLPRSRSTTGGYSQVEGRVGEYWYHAGMEAFFDDERQYAAAKAAARLGPPPPSGDANENPPPPPPLRTGVSNSHGRRARRDPPDQQCDGTAIGLFGLFVIGVFFVAGMSVESGNPSRTVTRTRVGLCPPPAQVTMPPLDGNGAGAAGDHSHDVVIDVGATTTISCAVCMEPLEWAAIGPCGHGDVCPGCSLHIRVFQNNRLCCICRSLCRVVVVVKHDAIAAAAAAGGGAWPAVSSRLPRSRTAGRGYSRLEGRVGEYWFHARMGAFFDDERQYAAAKAAARLGPPPCGDVNENPPPPPPPPTTTTTRTRTGVSNSDGQGSLLTPCEKMEALCLILIVTVFLVVMMFLDGNSAAGDHSHVVIDVDAAGDGDSRSRSRSCAVCLEPLVWAAIGRCGHGEVCAGCALHIRVFQNNRRCCICRSLCRVVVVTNPEAIAAAGGWPAVSSRLPRSRTTGGGYSQVEGRVGEYWYLAGMGAFFDDERQYAAAKAAARLGPPPPCGKASEDHRPPQARRAGASNEQQRSRRDPPPDEQRVQLQYVEAVMIGLLLLFDDIFHVGSMTIVGGDVFEI
uniref:RING-type domain-containing protein n=1 Tax=Oryza punctata TaxID=4537 RepID=A0A0E0LNQ1_ORYPU